VTDLGMTAGAPLLIGMDFNINPMTAVIAQKAGDQCHAIPKGKDRCSATAAQKRADLFSSP
jgi:hypothetical protein